MDNALENNNLEEGQVNDNVGQDEATQQQESKGDWESQAKYFQSEKDKLQAENQKLKQYEQVGKMLESRPDIVNTISGMVQGGQPAVQEKRVELSKDEFDPWEAYNDPSSKSYKFRQQELQETINTAGVLQRMDIVQQLQGQLQQAQEAVKNLQGDLQTAHRESISARKRTEVEKFKTELKSQESESKSANKVAIGKLENAVKLESEKLRLRSQTQEKQERLQRKGE